MKVESSRLQLVCDRQGYRFYRVFISKWTFGSGGASSESREVGVKGSPEGAFRPAKYPLMAKRVSELPCGMFAAGRCDEVEISPRAQPCACPMVFCLPVSIGARQSSASFNVTIGDFAATRLVSYAKMRQGSGM